MMDWLSRPTRVGLGANGDHFSHIKAPTRVPGSGRRTAMSRSHEVRDRASRAASFFVATKASTP